MKALLLSLLITASITSYTQTSADSIAGEYYLQGVMETASGFKFNPDSTFEFFFSYGALDRYGAGIWTIRNNAVVLNSRSRQGQDFTLVNSKSVPGSNLTIQIAKNNPMLLDHVMCIIKTANGENKKMTDKAGTAKFPKTASERIQLIFEFCPEKISTFSVTDPSHNYFEFNIEPEVFEVFFSNFQLQVEKNLLKGKHPLLEKDAYQYEKAD